MRIGLITLSFWPRRGGMEFVVHDLANALHDLGHDTWVFAPKLRGEYQEIEHRYNLSRFGLTFPGAFRVGFNRLVLLKQFASLHRKMPFDVLNAHSAYFATTYASDLKASFCLPLIVTCHGHDIQRIPEIGYGYRLDAAKDRIIQRNFAKANLITSISDSIHDELVTVVPKSKIVRIPNGIDLNSFKGKRTNMLRERLGLNHEKIILSVGRNTPKKTFDIGLRAFALVCQQESDVVYVHIGRDEEPLTHLSRELGTAHRFFTLGELQREEVLRAYRSADIFFSPAAVEAFALANLEAMASGLPCIVTNGPGNRDSIVHGENGWVVPVGNQHRMAELLLDLLRNKKRRFDFGTASMKLVQQYNWPNVARRYVQAFQAVVRGRRTIHKSFQDETV